jgi:GxxExxY protein
VSTLPSSDALNRITSTVIAAAIRVHKTLGPGLLESAYLACLCHEIASSGLRIETQKPISLMYRGILIDCAYRADLIVEKHVLVEVKAVDALAPIHSQQMYTYLRVIESPIGLLLNFGAATMKAGIKRVVNRFPDAT